MPVPAAHLRDLAPAALEREGWEALARGAEAATAFYQAVLDRDAMMLLPGGIVLDGRSSILASMSGPPWERYALAELRCLRPTPDTALLRYAAVAARNGQEYSALISSLYVRRPRGWKLTFHQQTPQ